MRNIKKTASFFIICFSLFSIFINSAFADSSIETQHFRVLRFEGKVDESKLREAGQKLESAYADVTALLGITSYKSGKIEARVWGGKPIRPHMSSYTVVNFHIDYIDIPIIRHELAHILLHKCLPNVPRWFDEGIAQYAERGLIMALDRLPSYPGDFALRKLDNVFTKADIHKGEVSSEEERAYLYSYGAVSYLIERYGKEKLGMVLQGRGDFNGRFEKAYGKDVEDFEKELINIY